MMGSGGMIVLDDHNCMVDIAKFYLEFSVEESCGKCTPCREGTVQLYNLLDKITKGEGTVKDLEKLKRLSKTVKNTSLCGLGMTAPNPILSTLEHFYDEYLEHVEQKLCSSSVCKGLISEYFITDDCVGCTICAKRCPVDCITGSVKGLHVIDQSAFEFSLLEIGNWVEADQSTGRIVHVPNGKIFTDHLANYDKGFKYIWNEIRVVITFESDWQKTKKILLKIAKNRSEHITATIERQIKRAARKFMIYYKNLTPIVYTDVKDHGVQLTIRHLCETRKRRGYTESMWEDILIEFAKHNDIDLAYPTTRFYKQEQK